MPSIVADGDGVPENRAPARPARLSANSRPTGPARSGVEGAVRSLEEASVGSPLSANTMKFGTLHLAGIHFNRRAGRIGNVGPPTSDAAV